jgi:hypothetical protein
MFNATHIGPSSSAAVSNYQTSTSNMNHHLDSNQTQQLGYGLGRLARVAFDQIANTWQSWWNKPSAEQIAMQRRIRIPREIFRHQIRELVPHLDSAFVNIRKNPKDREAFNRIQKIAADSASLLVPHEDEDVRAYQIKQFKRLDQRISTLQPFVKDQLRSVLPLLFQDGTSAEKQEDKEEQTTELSPSRVSVKKAKENVPHTKKQPEAKKESQHVFNQRATCGTLSYDLNPLNGTQGFMMTGPSAGFGSNSVMASVGDINGDGKKDFAIGTPTVTNLGGALRAGAVTIIFGGTNVASVNLASLTAAQGFVIYGLQQNDNLGNSIVGLGDFNGDGKDDIAIGAPNLSAITQNPKVYVLFGPLSSTIDLSTLNGINGFIINGQTNSQFAAYLAGGSDINGDGKNDLIGGAPRAKPSGTTTGAFYGIFGQATPLPTELNVTQLDGTNGFIAPGTAANGFLGYVVAMGEFNGVPPADFVVGAPNVDSAGKVDNGMSYVFSGHTGAWTSPLSLTSALFTASGSNDNDLAGNSVMIGGDLNHDGKQDLVIGSSPASSSVPGNIYPLYQQPATNPFNLANVDGANGSNLQGPKNGASFGDSIVSMDINNDGNSDLIAGMSTYNTPGGLTSAGGVVIVYGQPGGLPAQLNLATASSLTSLIVEGIAAFDKLGYSIANLQDINGDGIADLGVTAPGTGNGNFYILFGQNIPLCTTTSSVTSQSSTTSSSSTTTPSSSPNNLGPIIGGVVGGVVVIAGLTVTVLLLRFNKKGCFAENEVPKRNNDDGIFTDI